MNLHPPSPWKRFTLAWLALLLAACSGLTGGEELATPLPADYIPTAIALTLEAANPATPTPEPGSASAAPTETPTPIGTPTDTPTITPLPTETPVPVTPLPPTHTPVPQIPAASVQIYRLGDLSKVTSPIEITTYLTAGDGKNARVDLHGEDGRLLARQVKTFESVPWNSATFTTELVYEISAEAELGRLVISIEDIHGRMVAVNSVNLILLAEGDPDINPATALQESLLIKEPSANTLIQGGKLLVSGLIKPFSNQPLRVELVTQDGQVIGQRLAAITPATDGGYATFAAEVPYSVAQLTTARLIVYEIGTPLSDIAHLSSLEVILSP